MKTATRPNLNILHWTILHLLHDHCGMDGGKVHEHLETLWWIGHLEEYPQTRTALLELEYWKLVRVNQATGTWFLTYKGERLVKEGDPDED